MYKKAVYECLDSVKRMCEEGTYLITGADSYITKYIVCALLEYKRMKPDKRIKVIAVVHRLEHAEEVFEDYLKDADLKIIEADVREDFSFGSDIDYIIHSAGLSKNKVCRELPCETYSTNVIGTSRMLDTARKNKVRKFMLLSSASVYGDTNQELLDENTVGILQFNNPSNMYAVSKRMAEAICFSYSKEYHVPICIVRPFHLYGPDIESEEGRIVGEFIESAIKNGHISLQSCGTVKRNLTYITDVINALFTVLWKGRDKEIFNIGSLGENYSILELAEKVIDVFGNTSKDSISIMKEQLVEKQSNNLNMLPNLEQIQRLGWVPKYNLNDGLEQIKEYNSKIVSGMYIFEKA